MNYGFIGFGNMAKAIYHGLKNDKGINFAYVSKDNKHQEISSFDSLEKLVSFADVIWLCIKPQDLTEILEELKTMNLENKLLISIIAGKEIKFIEDHLDQKTAIVRTMPNMAIAYNKSVTAYCLNQQALQEKHQEAVGQIKKNLSDLGEAVEIPEEKFDLFTAIFGCGPAFLLETMKAFKKKTSKLELEDQKVNDMLIELLSGTLTYFQENKKEKSITELIQAITSKGGVTIEGLKNFQENKLGELFEKVIETAENKSKEMR